MTRRTILHLCVALVTLMTLSVVAVQQEGAPASCPDLDVSLYVGPPVTGDAMPIPPQGSPTEYFVAELRIAGILGQGALSPPLKLYLFSGDTKARSASSEGYDVNFEVTIEESGHRAVVSLEVWRDGLRLLRQYQALWLTTDPAQRIPGGVPER
ncbi:MAG: hypothetical protein PVG92_05795 [Holophagae bacterium]|jgi:hypothetical protein